MQAAPSGHFVQQQNDTGASFDGNLDYSMTEVLMTAGHSPALVHPNTAVTLSFHCRGHLWEFLQFCLWPLPHGRDWVQWQASFGQQSYLEPFA